MQELIERYVDFSKLKNPIRLLVSAVNVERPSWSVRQLCRRPDGRAHSGERQPAAKLSWTTINGRHYWDSGIVSNSPLDRHGTLRRDGQARLRRRSLPSVRPHPESMEVSARRDEIVYSGGSGAMRSRAISHAITGWSSSWKRSIRNSGRMMRQRPRFIQLMGEIAPPDIVRIVRDPDEDETLGRDYDFSQKAVKRNRDLGYAATIRKIEATGKP
jgi:NTE family protein